MTSQLLLYAWEPGARFEGGVLGALERAESGAAVRVLDALWVGTDPDSGELAAFDLRADGAADGVLFRLDPAERRRVTKRTLNRKTGVSADTIHALARELAPGRAIVAVLVEHAWLGALEEAVARSGGTRLANELVDAAALDDLAPRLVAAVRMT